ncbi:golgin subfamily A member 5-like [Ostrinia nubilalis]|uniref:golgin subfamily A member 5-like n=1 Tax=Ostrinia nubilalis TaxID=29057 RepID=UPI0030825A2B
MYATERVVTALRDALRDERAAKNRAEAQCLAIGKDKSEILSNLCRKTNCDILCVQETHRDETQSRPQIAGLKLIAEISHPKHVVEIYIDQLESRHSATERVVTALRDALRDERAAKNRAEAQCLAIGKELKTVQIETGQTIASLRTALRDKENELTNLRNTTSSIRTTDTSALNVADYDVMQESIDNDKIHYLTETLVQKQGKIDSLLADNNMLRIQLEKLESKFKAEVMSKRNHTHSVHVEDRDRCRSRHQPVSALSALSVRFSVAMKRHPLFRTFIVIYMICLHLWVLTVLFTSTPDGHIPRHVKS